MCADAQPHHTAGPDEIQDHRREAVVFWHVPCTPTAMESVRITFRDVQRSPALETQIRERAQKLERFSQRMTDCHVVVEVPHRHRTRGYLFTVRIEAAIPGGEIVVEPHQREGYADAHVAVRDAFDALTRRLEDHERRGRDEAKSHRAHA